MYTAAQIKAMSPDSRSKALKEQAKQEEVKGAYMRVSATLESQRELAVQIEKYLSEEHNINCRDVVKTLKKKETAPKRKAVFHSPSDGAPSSGGQTALMQVNIASHIPDDEPFQKNITTVQAIPVWVTKFVLSVLHPSSCSPGAIKALGRKKHEQLFTELFVYLSDVEAGDSIPLSARTPQSCAEWMLTSAMAADPLPSSRPLLLRVDIQWENEGVYSLEYEESVVYVKNNFTQKIVEVKYASGAVEETMFDSLVIEQNYSRYGADIVGNGEKIKIFPLFGEKSRVTLDKKRSAAVLGEQSAPTGRKKKGASRAEVSGLLLQRAASFRSEAAQDSQESTGHGQLALTSSPASTSNSPGPAAGQAPSSELQAGMEEALSAEDLFAPPAPAAS